MAASSVQRHLISYPKSGRTWLHYMLVLLEVAPQIIFHHDGFEFSDGELPEHDFDLDRRLASYGADDKLVYLERDPRAVMVSLFHQVNYRLSDIFGLNTNLSEFIRHPYFGAENLLRFRLMWSEISQRRPVLTVRYEDIHQDPLRVLRSIVAHYEFAADDARFRSAVDGGTFQAMTQVERSDQFAEPWLRRRNGYPKMRRGKIASFREELSQDDLAYLNGIFDIVE